MTPSSQFVMSIENECLTAVLTDRGGGSATERLFDAMRSLAPTLPATAGIFNGYGRVYVDCGHIETAACECDSPYALVSVIESQQRLLAKAVAQLAAEGRCVVLANNNHSGLLHVGCPVWGAHENFLVEEHPSSFAELILPFLATRIYQGAGGIEFPTGNFLAAVRPIAIELETGGGTTDSRAIHSTAREEHHMGQRPKQFRYHGILGDGHRSGYNLSLQAGATALALKAIFYDRKLPKELQKLKFPEPRSWVTRLKSFNRLSVGGSDIRVDPLVIQTQHVYLAAAHRYADLLGSSRPAWIDRSLGQWEETLHHLTGPNIEWLAQRLDAFIKYAFYSMILEGNNISWRDLPQRAGMFNELTLLDHRYHEFTSEKSWFSVLDRKGLLQQRMCDFVEPGEEAEPFIPPVQTRAAARAKLIREKAGTKTMVVDWAWVNDMTTGQPLMLDDPFAQEFRPREATAGDRPATSSRPPAERFVTEAHAAYDRGEYTLAQRYIDHLQSGAGELDVRQRLRLIRLHAWVRSRMGFPDGETILESLFRGRRLDVQAVTDMCCVYRFRGLVPHDGIQQWLDRGMTMLDGVEQVRDEPAGTQALREHAAARLSAAGRHVEALEPLELACQPARLRGVTPRIKARLLAAKGDVLRALGDRERAGRFLQEADQIHAAAGTLGDRAEFTLAAMARLETNSAQALNKLHLARQTLRRLGHRMGLARIMLLEARIGGDVNVAAECHERVVALQQQVPALGQCPRLAAIVEDWPAWVAGEAIAGLPESADRFCGV